SWLAVSCVAANQMWTKGNRERLVQMFMHGYSAARQRRTKFGSFELPNAIAKTNRIIPSYHALMLQGENQVQLWAPQRDESSAALAGFDAEAAVELFHIFLSQKPISCGRRGDLAQSQFLRQPPLPRSEEHTSELQSPYDLVC